MEGSQRMMQLLPANVSLKQLPYRVANESDLLIAFRQHGCAHWDLLGGGESCEYIWDDPRATHALQLHASDVTGTAIAHSVPAAYFLDRTEPCTDLRLEPVRRCAPPPIVATTRRVPNHSFRFTGQI
eukprot:5683902-Prymnesium_polylepis.2